MFTTVLCSGVVEVITALFGRRYCQEAIGLFIHHKDRVRFGDWNDDLCRPLPSDSGEPGTGIHANNVRAPATVLGIITVEQLVSGVSLSELSNHQL